MELMPHETALLGIYVGEDDQSERLCMKSPAEKRGKCTLAAQPHCTAMPIGHSSRIRITKILRPESARCG